jgi:L-asparagine oxygenase
MGNLHRIKKDGYLLLNELHPEVDSTTVISSLGTLQALGDGPAVHCLAPMKKENSTPNTYSGMYGLGAFPFHTDLAHRRYPPRYLALRCIIGFEDVPTLLLDGDKIASDIGRSLLSRSLVRPRRPRKRQVASVSVVTAIGRA